MNTPKIWLFGSWTPNWGWSWIKKILERIVSWEIKAEVGVLVTNYEGSWVAQSAKDYKDIVENLIVLKNSDFPKRGSSWEFSEKDIQEIRNIYQKIVSDNGLDFVFLSGWLKLVLWIEANKCINIHPGPIKEPYWWLWMHWNNVHKKIWEDYQGWEIHSSCVTMHYVTEGIDEGPIIFQRPIPLRGCESAEDIAKRVNKGEHFWQWFITKYIIEWKISWTGNPLDPVKFPDRYDFWKEVDLKEIL